MRRSRRKALPTVHMHGSQGSQPDQLRHPPTFLQSPPSPRQDLPLPLTHTRGFLCFGQFRPESVSLSSLENIIEVRCMAAILPYSSVATSEQTSTTLQGQHICRSGTCKSHLLRHLRRSSLSSPQYKQEGCLDNDWRTTVTTHTPWDCTQ